MHRTSMVVAVLLVCASGFAQVPPRLTYQGRILNTDGTPATGPVPMTFALFPSQASSSESWSEQLSSVPLTDGFYAVVLGSQTPLGAAQFVGPESWLQITIDGHTLAPRQRIESVPYALMARDLKGGAVDATSVSIGGQPVIDSSGKLTGPAAYTIGSGLRLTGKTLSLPLTCAANDTLIWSSGDWSCGTGSSTGGLSSVTSDAPLSGAGTSANHLKVPAASAGADGYLKSTDWGTFNGKANANGSNALVGSSWPINTATANGLSGSPTIAVANISVGYDITNVGHDINVVHDVIAGNSVTSFAFKSTYLANHAPSGKYIPVTVDEFGILRYFAATSDARLKLNLRAISDTLDVEAALMLLRGVYFNWDLKNPENEGRGPQTEIGLIAQEVEQVLPELVGMGGTGYRSIDYSKFPAFLVEVAKAQHNRINELKREVDELKAAKPAGTPTALAGAAAGQGADVVVTGNDRAGTLSLRTGRGTLGGTLVELRFGKHLSTQARVLLTPANAESAELRYYRHASGDRFSIEVARAPQGGATYEFDYLVAQ